jgi:tetratricopeptide (TPR) repeat protein
MAATPLRRFWISAALVAAFAMVANASAQESGRTPTTAPRMPPGLVTLTPAEVQELEDKVKADPDDAARMQLLRHYGREQFRSAEARDARQKHVLWLIQHRPALELGGPEVTLNPRIDGAAYDEGKRLWEKHVQEQPENVTILTRAATYLLLYERGTAEGLFKKAESLEPTNPRWPERLAHLYSLSANTPAGVDSVAAGKALAAMERAHGLATDGGFNQLVSLAKMALTAGDAAKARDYAQRVLRDAADYAGHWNHGNAIHDGNSVLGRLALSDGKVETAKTFLLAAGKTPGSPQLNSFGPDVALAAELLDKGEKEAVLAYFELCRVFWNMGGERLDAWTQAVKENRLPDFGSNRRR